MGLNSICIGCDPACQTCERLSTNCTLCNSTAFREMNISGYCQCMVGYFGVTNQQLCMPCYTNCLSCVGTLSTNCLTCSNTSYYLNSSCYATCPSSYINISTPSRICTPCPTNCLACPASAVLCTSCVSPYFIFTQNSTHTFCLSECP